MKKAFTPIILTLLLFLVTGSTLAQTGKAALTGVWKYEWEGWEGIAILSPTHFIWLLTAENRQEFNSSAPSVAEKAKAFDALIAAGGTWELVSDNQAKATASFSINPETKKTPTIWDFEREGDMLISWIINPDGSRQDTPIRCRKLADWGVPSEVSMFHGVWEYVGQNGLYLQAGSYGAWIIVNGPQVNPSTDEGKAKNFDGIHCSVAVGTHLADNRHIWNILHSWDIRQEKAAYFTDCEMPNPDLVNMWFVDAKGKQLGEKWQVRRVGR